MTTAIFIQDGIVQLVLTPETEWEKSAMKMLADGSHSVTVKRGSFYECRGGYTRHEFGQFGGLYSQRDNKDDSLILRVERSSENS